MKTVKLQRSLAVRPESVKNVLIACLMLLLVYLVFEQQQSPREMRLDLSVGQHGQVSSAEVSSAISEPVIATPVDSTSLAIAADSSNWKYVAMCDNSKRMSDQLLALEEVIEPMQLMRQLLQQEGHTWLQIGSNTMEGYDPLMKNLDFIPTWRKVFVEPIPTLFEKLEESVMRWPNATAVNVALSPNRSIAETKAHMWCFSQAFDKQSDKRLPIYAKRICSFNASHVTKHFSYAKLMPVEVTAVNMEELLRRTNIEDIQVLMIDTEGVDYKVLSQIPFEHIRPSFVFWEHNNLSPLEQVLAEEHMRRHCYAVKKKGPQNTMAVALFK